MRVKINNKVYTNKKTLVSDLTVIRNNCEVDKEPDKVLLDILTQCPFYSNVDKFVITVNPEKPDSKMIVRYDTNGNQMKYQASLTDAVDYLWTGVVPCKPIFRKAVIDSINEFRETHEPDKCGLCNKEFTDDEKSDNNKIHVDHIIYFDQIVTDFIRDNNINEKTFGLLVDSEKEPVKQKFKEYHDSFKDNLRYTHKTCNLKRPKWVACEF